MKAAKPGRRNRIADQIARLTAEIVQREVRDPRVGLVTITGCEITPDYAHAKVFFTCIGPTPEECQEGLNAASGMIRSIIFPQLLIHTVPRLHFVIDKSVEHGFAMDRIIDRAMARTRADEAARGEESAVAPEKDHGKER